MDKNGKTGRPYSAEEKAAAVRMVRNLRVELWTDRGTAQRVALQLGYGVESFWSWVRQADIDGVADWEENRKVYGVRKLWKAARRSGIDIGRDQKARLMRSLGIEGVKRSKRVKTTRPDPTAVSHPDLGKRDFTATARNQLCVTDLTFVPTWAGVAYVCFIIDAYSRTIVGWPVASHMKTETVLDSIEVVRWRGGPGANIYLD